MELAPTALYSSPLGEHSFEAGDGPHSTDGRTTQISDIVVKAGGNDRNRPSKAKDTPLGRLRERLTTVQDQLNEFLTARMQSEKEDKTANDVERRLLDEGVDEDSDWGRKMK